MRKLVTTGLLTAAAVIAAPAVAAPTIVWNLNNFVMDEPGAVILFNGYNGPGYTASAGGTPYVRNTAPTASTPGEVTTGPSNLYVNGTVAPGASVDPSQGANTLNYLSIGAPSSYTITFASAVQYFSFIVGSVDSYNTLTLTDSAGGTFSYSGLQMIGQAAVGPQNNNIFGRVEYYFNGGPGLVSATLSSTDLAFEVDEFAAAVPEPATWAMMMIGFGAAGGALRASRRRASRANGLATA